VSKLSLGFTRSWHQRGSNVCSSASGPGSDTPRKVDRFRLSTESSSTVFVLPELGGKIRPSLSTKSMNGEAEELSDVPAVLGVWFRCATRRGSGSSLEAWNAIGLPKYACVLRWKSR
jgi:hypothetical protein